MMPDDPSPRPQGEGEASPRPWRVDTRSAFADIADATGAHVCRCRTPELAALIVRAVDSEQETIAALSWALDLLDYYDERLAEIDGPTRVYSNKHVAGLTRARAALALAKGETQDE